jgi:hypothetical protein
MVEGIIEGKKSVQLNNGMRRTTQQPAVLFSEKHPGDRNVLGRIF